MQLAHAIDGWLEAHGANLSTSTRRDIEHIRDSTVETGWGELPCAEIDRGVREDIIDEATKVGTLGGSAIGEFLTVVVRWAADQPDQVDKAPLAMVDDGLGPSGAFHDDADDEDQSDPDEPHDDEDDTDEDDTDDDDDDTADDEDDDDDTADESDADEDEDDTDDESDADEDEDDTDDDDEDEDAESDDDDEEDSDADESDDDDDDDEEDSDADDRDPDDWVGFLREGDDGFEGLTPENEPVDVDLSADEKAAASSFFDAIGSSKAKEPEIEPIVVLDADEAEKPKGGVFSAAAEQVPPKPASGTDWITVAYFSVAAICFALVIYFYLSS